MTIAESATEFAADKGHEQYPLLHATYSPNSRVPCTDFSPWIRDRLEVGDHAAVIAYVLQIVQANPGIGLEVSAEVEEGFFDMKRVSKSSPMWVSSWSADARFVLGMPFDSLSCASSDWELDLRTTLVMLLPIHSPLSLVSLHEDRQPDVLAAMMSVHDVQLSNPEEVAQLVNSRLRRDRDDGFPVAYPEVSVDDIATPELPLQVPEVVWDLPLASRSHLFDISSRARRNGPGLAAGFSTFYRTRQVGCDESESLSRLIGGGLLCVVDDPETVWQIKAMSLTADSLRDLLTNAGIQYPKSGTKAVLLQRARPIADTVMTAVGEAPVVELTSKGRVAADWVNARVKATARMWAAWGALGDRSWERMHQGGNGYDTDSWV